MHSDTYEALAQRCERGADTLEQEAARAADILAERGYPDVDAHDWAARKTAAASAARAYAAELRAEAGDRPQVRPEAGRLAQAERVASAAELGGILIDGRPMAERDAQSASVFNQHVRKLWEAGKHPAQEKATEIEATGKFVHVDETIDGVKQVPFWQLGGPANESTTERDNRRRAELSQQARDGRNAADPATRAAWRARDEAYTRPFAAPAHDPDEF